MNTIQWLTQLISFNSISGTSNVPLIEAIDAWFKLHGINSQIVAGPADDRVNLFATIPASNGQMDGGILLSGHTDVVPVTGQIWHTDPFIAREKGRRLYHCQIQGKATHSSLAFEGCNAVEYASQLICYINSIARYVKENGPFDKDFDCPFTTITTNIISGGIAMNVIPSTCEFILEVRYINSFPLVNFHSQIENYINNELLPEMKKPHPEAAIYFDEISDAHGFNAMEDSTITRIVRMVTGIKERFKVSYGTEAGTLQNAHIPTVICGPGDIKQAHNPNEFITIEQLDMCERVLKNVVTLFCVDLQK